MPAGDKAARAHLYREGLQVLEMPKEAPQVPGAFLTRGRLLRALDPPGTGAFDPLNVSPNLPPEV